MRRTLLVLGVILLMCIGVLSAKQSSTQQKPVPGEPQMTPEEVGKKNPIGPTPEGLAEARKLYGYHCAMCHNKDGGGKGELAVEMKLELLDWRAVSISEKMTGGGLFFLIIHGPRKNFGWEVDPLLVNSGWNLVDMVPLILQAGPGAIAT